MRPRRPTRPLLPVLVALLLLVLAMRPPAVAAASGDTWHMTGPMTVARAAFSATLLPNGLVLVAGGVVGKTLTASAELYDPTTNAWRLTGSMTVPRAGHTATLLADGRVLVAGSGVFNASGLTGVLASAELYDPASGTWQPTGSMSTGRLAHTATRLNDGRVLVIGGFAPDAAAEVYDPRTGSWTPASSNSSAWQGASGTTATLLGDGTVLVAGGIDSEGRALATAARYDPATNVWQPTGSLDPPRYGHTATLLADGTVLVAGGSGGHNTDLVSAERYDPASGTWRATGRVAVGRREGQTATLLATGQVLRTIGDSFAELYDPRTDSWRPTVSPPVFGAVATALSDGTVLLLGEDGRAAVFVPGLPQPAAPLPAPPRAGTWQPTGSLGTPRTGHTATLLADGRVLVAGGVADPRTNTGLITAELYDPASGRWQPTGSMSTGRTHHAAALLLDGTVLVVGGGAIFAAATAERYDPATAAWRAVAPPPADMRLYAGCDATATTLRDSTVLVTGCADMAARYDPGTNTWTTTGRRPFSGTLNAAATLLRDGTVLVVGSGPARYDPASNTWRMALSGLPSSLGGVPLAALPDGTVLAVARDQAAVYDPGVSRWREVARMVAARMSQSLTVLPDGTVLAAGGFDQDAPSTPGQSATPLASAERYDPASATWFATADLGTARAGQTATLLRDGSVLVVGGRSGEGALASAERYTLVSPAPAGLPSTGAGGGSARPALPWPGLLALLLLTVSGGLIVRRLAAPRA